VANAHASSSIEGNPLSLEEARAVAKAASTPASPPQGPHEREILQHLSYFRSIEDRAAPVGAPGGGEVVDAHRKLLDGILAARQLGRLRNADNRIRVYFGRNEGSPPERVAVELASLQTWFDQAGGALLTPVRIAIWFHEFESIHPFGDGNGRVGRALTHRLLRTEGLPNSVFVALDAGFNRDRAHYYAALDSVRVRGDYGEWVAYFLECLARAYEEAHAVLRRASALPAGFVGAQRAILEHALRTGIRTLRVADLVRSLEVYQPGTITTALAALQHEHGLLRHNGGRGRASAFEPSPRFDDLLEPPTGPQQTG
jgi:Fic family protein